MSGYLSNILAMMGMTTITRAMGMVTTVIMARVLGSAQFGLYSIVVNTANSAYGMVSLGIDAAIHVHTAQHHDDAASRAAKGQLLGAGFLLLMLAGIAGGLGCWLGAPWIAATIYKQPELTGWLSLSGILVFIQCMTQFCWTLLAGLHRFEGYAKVMSCMSVTSTLLLSLASLYLSLAGALKALIVVQLLTILFLSRLARSAMALESIRIKYASAGISVLRLLKIGLPFYLAGLVNVPTLYYAQGLLTQTAGIESMGGLRVIGSITALVTFLPSSIAGVMVSALTKKSTSDYGAFVSAMLLNIKYIWLFSMICAAGVVAVLPMLFDLLFGDEYRGFAAPAGIAIVASVFICVLGVVGNIAFSRQKVAFILFYNLVQAAVFMVMVIALVPRHGLVGFLVAQTVSVMVALCFVWWRTKRWRKSNQVAPAWVYKLALVSFIYAIIIIHLGVNESEAMRILVSPAAFAVMLSVGYWGILSGRERAVLIDKFTISRG